MQKSIPSLNKQFQCSTFLKAFVLIAFLQVQVLSDVKINPVNSDIIYDFNVESLKYKKTENKLDFTKGTWTHIKDVNVIEFAPEEPTLLIFSTKNSSEFIYLEQDKRVLVFSFDGEKNISPYVRETHKNTDDEDDPNANFNEFYDSAKNSEEDLQKMFKETCGFIEESSLSPEELSQIKDNLTRINHVPFYNLERRKTAFNFQNKIGFFQEDDGSALVKWANDKKILTGNWAELISNENHAVFKQTLVARLMLVMFFKDSTFLFLKKLSSENQAKAMLLYENAMARAKEVISNNDTPELQASFDKIIAFLSTFAGRMVTLFYSEENYPFLNDLFRPRIEHEDYLMVNVSLNEHLEMRKTWRRKRMEFYTVESIKQVYNLFADDQNSDNIQEGLEEQQEQAKAGLLNIFDTLFNSMAKKVPDLGNIKVEEQTEFEEFLRDEYWKPYKKMKNCFQEASELKNNYDENPFETEFDGSIKDDIIDFITKSDFMIFTKDFAQTLYIPFSMEAFEDHVIKKLSDFPVISEMKLKFSDDDDGRNALEVFREMLYTVDILEYKPVTYDSKMKTGVSRSIFTWESGRRMLLV
jgi:hypothetical protein